MAKVVSCGILIFNEKEELLMGKVTGSKHFDIPKGQPEGNETPVETAIRETKEEFGLTFTELELTDLGVKPYIRTKDLHLFLTVVRRIDIDFEDLKCTSSFYHPILNNMVPEIQSYEWVPVSNLKNKCCRSMFTLLETMLNET